METREYTILGDLLRKKKKKEKYSIFKMFIQAAIISMGQKETNKQTEIPCWWLE